MLKKSQLVIVCRNFLIDWTQFINPVYVGVETGILALLENKLPINFVCGDFDTLNEHKFHLVEKAALKNNFKIIRVSEKKDYLDSELAIIKAKELKISFSQIVLVTDGNRWDMILAQINLLRKYNQYNPILISNDNYVFSLKAKEKFSFTSEHLKYRYISFFTLDNQEVMYNFIGCKYYNGVDIIINNEDVLSISNEFDLGDNKHPEIEIKKGNCLVLLSDKIN